MRWTWKTRRMMRFSTRAAPRVRRMRMRYFILFPLRDVMHEHPANQLQDEASSSDSDDDSDWEAASPVELQRRIKEREQEAARREKLWQAKSEVKSKQTQKRDGIKVPQQKG